MTDNRFTNWEAFISYQKERQINDELLEIIKNIFAHIQLQYQLAPDSIFLRKEKMTFHSEQSTERSKLFLNVHIKKSFLRLLLINDGKIPTIATKVEGVKGYPDLHKIELKKKEDFTTEVRIAILPVSYTHLTLPTTPYV